MSSRVSQLWATLVFILLPVALAAQRQTGELRLTVIDPQQATVAASVDLSSEATHFREVLTLTEDGKHTFRGVPFGTYTLRVQAPGFAPVVETVDVRSEIPESHSVTLGLAQASTVVEVDATSILDPYRLGSAYRVNKQELATQAATTPGRQLLNSVLMQPGWLLEANGVLHPRGSEYDTQYVIDGIPIQDNRSPAFAPALETDNVQSLTVMTGGYPAEYGKKMGGVVEVTTTADRSPGLHVSSVLDGGSFNTGSAFLALQYGTATSNVRVSADGFRTDRYLDPPVLDNFTNHGSGSGFTAAYERDLSDRNRIRFSVARRATDFQVPNELVQQLAGQRQGRKSGETAGQFAFDHIFSDSLLSSVRVMSRDVSSLLGSNPLSTPIVADQDRGFRETYVGGNISAHRGRHEIKTGAEFSFAAIHENFGYRITAYDLKGIPMFDPNLPAQFRFKGRHDDHEQSAFAQDTYHSGRLTINAGVRYDRYHFLTTEHAFSPRLAASWQVPSARLLVHAAYDRMFTTPAMENLLLSGSAEVRALFPDAEYIPVRPARGNSYQAGLTFRPAAKLRFDVTHYLRTTNNFGDDELLLNTGISFPIAFNRATIEGTEARLELVSTGRFSGVLSYTNMSGRARLPIAGGLFLPSEEEGPQEFAITQDQRNTVSARIGARATKRLWTAVTASYGSGLPVELEDERPISFYISQYGEEIVQRVNLERGRVRPNFSLDASAVAQLWNKDRRSVSLQLDALNLTDRVNVINFAGILSGTAVANPRSFGARLRMEF